MGDYLSSFQNREWERDKAVDKKSLNLEFYKNKMKAKPCGCKIEEMLKWRGDYHALENNHSYIQWLFPTQEYSNFNSYVQPIQFHEALEIRDSPEMQRRFVRAYTMMLDFYGMELVSEETGEVQTTKNWKDRFRHLNRSTHNFYRITRIFIALGIFGYEHFQPPWLMFMMEQKFVHRTLPDILFGAMHHWIGTISNDTSREYIVIQFQEFSDKWNAQGHHSLPGPRRSNAHVPPHDEALAENIDNLHMTDPMPTHATLESYTFEENVDNVHNTPRSQPENKDTAVGIKSGKRRITVDDVKEGLDSGDNETVYQTINAILEDTDGTEYNLQLASGSDAADTIRATNDEHTKDIRSGNKAFGNTYDRRQLAWGSDAADTIRATNDEHTNDIRSGNKAFGNTYDRRQLAWGSDAADTIRATNDEHTKDIRSGNKEFGNTYDRRQLAWGSDAADTIRATNGEHSKDIRSGNKEFGNTYDRRQLAWGSDAADTIRATNDEHSKDIRSGNKEFGNTYARRQLACASDAADTIRATNDEHSKDIRSCNKEFGNTYDRRQLACASDAADTIRATNGKHTHDVKDNRTGNNRYGNTYMFDRRQLACVSDTSDTTVEGTNSYARQHSNNDGLAFDNLNLKFYRNEIVSKPVGRKIEDILKLDGDHVAIEENPAFFHWLFPTQQRSRSNRFAQPLQVHEAEAIRDTPELKARFLRAYKMMLDFYGMELASEVTGEVQRNPRTCRERLIYLNRSPSDHPRITRIITSLGILGFKHYQLPWLRFLIRESLREGPLTAIPTEVLQQHWVSALSSDEDQISAEIYYMILQDEKK